MRGWTIAIVLVAGVVAGLSCDHEQETPAICKDESSLSIYEDRIAPLLADGNKSACNQCHLAGVDLGLYSKDADECTTMACMVETGIVDLDKPEDSVVLTWILRGTPDSTLITTDVLQQEHDGMLEWIQFHATCGDALCGKIDNPCGEGGPAAGTCETPHRGHDSPPTEFDDPGDCSDITFEQSFAELVYSWRGRCYPCHWSSRPGDPKDAPRWIVDGACNIGALESMRQVIDLGLVDVEHPTNSLLLLKPLAVAVGGVEHSGGDKFYDTNDGAYQDFLKWIELYAGCRG